MKNLKLFVFALCLLTMSLVTVSADPVEYKECGAPNDAYYVKYSDNTHKCFMTTDDALKSVKVGESAEIILLKDIPSYAANETFERNVTFNLNEHTIGFTTGSFTIKGATVTIKNGTLIAGNERILVDASEKATTLTIANDVTVEKGAANGEKQSVVKVNSAAKKTTLNINGTWEVANEIVNCAQAPKEELTVNLNAKVTGKGLDGSKSLLVLDAGNSVVNVNGGTYTSNQRVFTLVNGTLNINTGATLKATGDAAIVVEAANTDVLPQVLNIAGGNVTSTKIESVWFNGSTGTYKITNGTFESGKDADKKQLPALRIANPEFLDNHKGMITKGTFKGSIVGDVENEEGRHVDAEDAAKILVGNATVSEKDGVVTVGGTHTDTETGKKPEEQAPNTFDAGLTYVGLALSAIGASVVSVRKLKNN